MIYGCVLFFPSVGVSVYICVCCVAWLCLRVNWHVCSTCALRKKDQHKSNCPADSAHKYRAVCVNKEHKMMDMWGSSRLYSWLNRTFNKIILGAEG